MSIGSDGKKFLFICGCPRSGTTALWDIVSSHQKIAMGCERFNSLYPLNKVTTELFEKDRFFDIRIDDTHYKKISDMMHYPSIVNNFNELKQNYDSCKFFGDKFPFLYEYYPSILSSFPGCRIIFIMRNIFDVANSYVNWAKQGNPAWPESRNAEIAVMEWNRSLQMTKRCRHLIPFYIIKYENFFYKKEGLEDLFRYLDLDVDDTVTTRYHQVLKKAGEYENLRERSQILSSLDKRDIILHADFKTYRDLY